MNLVEKLPSRIDAVKKFISLVMESLSREYNLPEDDRYSIKLALEEALTNAVRHGHKDNPDYLIDVSVLSENQHLIIKVNDQGAGFDYNNLPDPTVTDKLMKTSGRGIYLIRKVMDEVHFGQGGREIKMVKKLSSR